MSRTYRRTRNGRKTDWLPNIWYRDWYALKYYRETFSEYHEFIARCPHRQDDINDIFERSMNWDWRYHRYTRPGRSQTRQNITKILKGQDTENMVWPCRKPKFYY